MKTTFAKIKGATKHLICTKEWFGGSVRGATSTCLTPDFFEDSDKIKAIQKEWKASENLPTSPSVSIYAPTIVLMQCL